MPDPRPRVFISSVMDGYAQFRDAAADGIRQAGREPVRAEDFPAAGHSPRNACLEAVSEAELTAAPNLENRDRERIDAALRRRPPESQGVVWLETAWTTLRDEEVIDPVDLGDAAFQRQVQRLAHECDPPLCSYEQPKRPEVSTSSLTITQGDPASWREARDLVTLEIRSDGTLSIAQNVSGTEARSGVTDGVFDLYFLAPSVVRERLERAWAFAASWWSDRDPYKRHDPLLFNLALHDVGGRRWGEPPRSSGGGITIPGECPRNPLFVYDRPRRVSRADSDAPASEIDRSLTMMQRAFQEWGKQW